MRKPKILAIGLIKAIVVFSGATGYSVESSGPKASAPGGSANPQKPRKQKYADSFFASGADAKPKTEKELKLVLSGLNSLIRIEKPGPKKNDLLISKAVTLLSLGKHFYLTGKTPADKELKEGYLKKAMNSAAEAGNTTYANVNTKARALHVYGMSALYLNNDAKAVEYFDQAIKLDPSSNLSPRLSVFIGEFHFDREQYEKALPYYGQFFTRLTPEEKALAIYKSGWCFLVTKQYENAEKAFLKIIGKSWAGDFATDALRDLAQTVTNHRNEQQILQFGVENFSKAMSEQLVTFYTDCYMIFLRQSGNVEQTALYNEILRLEKRPEKRVALAVKKMSSHQKGYASQQVVRDVTEVDSLITQGGLKPETDTFRSFGTDLEVEIKRSISSYVDTISKKVRSPEPMTEIELAARLQKFLWYHVTWFPNSPSLSQTYMISMDNCLYLKDAECSVRIGRLVLRQEKLKNVWPRARVEILVGLETLSAKDPKYKAEYLPELKAFVDSQMVAKEWLVFSKKLTVLYLSDKKFAEADPYLIKILQKEYTAENLYRKIFCQFQLQKYAEIVVHLAQIPKEGPFSNDIKTLIRESSLSLAKLHIEKNHFVDYEKYLFQFLNLQPDPEKADLAMADYLQKLMDRQFYDKVIGFYQKLPVQKKFQGPFSKPLEQLLIVLFSMNRFQEANDVLSRGSVIGQYRNFDPYWLRISLVLNSGLGERELKVLASSTPSVRMGVLALAAVSKPKIVLDYFSFMAPLDDKEKKIWVLARHMTEGSKTLALSAQEIQSLGGVIGPETLNVGALKSERLTRMVEFPQPTWSQERLARVTPDAMERVKSIRKQLLRDLKNQTPDVQKRLIVNGINVERRMAWFFDESPLPEGLTAAEFAEYQKEIDGFASEYYQQATEYEKLLAAVLSKENEISGDRLPLPNNLERWIRVKTPVLEIVEAEARKGYPLRSLIVLENQKALEKINDDAYYRWRSFIIMNQFPHEFAANFLQDELEAYKQSAVIGDWKKVVGLVQSADRSVASEPKSDGKGNKQ